MLKRKLVRAMCVAAVLIAGGWILCRLIASPHGVPPELGGVRSIKVYWLPGEEHATAAQLRTATSQVMPQELLQSVLKNSVHHWGRPVWKGSFFALAELEDGREVEMAVEMNGRRFWLADGSGYYEVENASGHDFVEWIRLLTKTQVVLPSTTSKED